jgi:peptide-methionine (S)-S-oxide reductase
MSLFHSTRSIRRTRLAGAIAVAVLGVAGAGLAVHQGGAVAAERVVAIAAPVFDEQPAAAQATEKAVFAGGCFWGVQGVFQHVRGVTRAVSGYAGGTADTAQYETVSGGGTGHAEAVEVTYDPKQITYGKLLQIFFSVAHDPTQLNRQGPDSGTQYRSTIFPENAQQRQIASQYIAQLDKSGAYPAKIVTTLQEGKAFYPAESYHQDYLTRNPYQPYIVINDLPKVAATQKLFPDLYLEKPVLVAR